MARKHDPDGFVAAVGIGFVVLVVGLAMINWLWFPLLGFTEQRDAGKEITEDTYDAEHARQAYEEFRTLYHEIESQREEVRNFRQEERQFHQTYGDDPSQWSRQAETRHGRIHERITGSQNQLEGLVADYNAKSSQAHTSVFKCHLPYQVDDRFAISGPPGSGSPEQPEDTGPNGTAVDGSPPPAEQCDGLPESIEQGGTTTAAE